MLSYVYNSEKVYLAQVAQEKMKEFETRKNRYKKEWVDQLVEHSRKEILLKASLGEGSTTFYMEKVFHDLKPLLSTIEDKEEQYEISNEDKDYLMTEVIRHYSNEKEYPFLICRPQPTYNTNALFFSWILPETEES